MTPLEILDSIYFHKDEIRLTAPGGKQVITTIDALFSQTAVMLEECSADEIRANINDLIIAFEKGISVLETLEMGNRQPEMRNAGY